MHHVRRKIIALVGVGHHPDGQGELDPPLVHVELIKGRVLAAGGAAELGKGIALVMAARGHTRPKPVVIGGTRILGLAIVVPADKDRRLLVNAVAQGVLTGKTVVVRIDGLQNPVFRFVGYGYQIEGEVDVRVRARLDTRRQYRGNRFRVGAVYHLQHRPVENFPGAALGCTAVLAHLAKSLSLEEEGACPSGTDVGRCPGAGINHPPSAAPAFYATGSSPRDRGFSARFQGWWPATRTRPAPDP